MSLFFGRAGRASSYIFWELVPTFALGNLIFIFILLSFQLLRLGDLIIVHGIPLITVGAMMFYMSVSFLPACIPLSLLFSVLLTYGRLSADSEITAMKASGLHVGHLLIPSLLLSFISLAFSAYLSFYGGPWGNRAFEVMIRSLLNSRAASTIQSGTFAEDFYDLVLYAGSVDSKQGILRDVFIYDERDQKNPFTIIAASGVIHDSDARHPGRGITLELQDGNIHRVSENNYTKVDFRSYDINLVSNTLDGDSEKSPQSWTWNDIERNLRSPQKDARLQAEGEFHKRWAMAFACLVFGILGVGTGTSTNRRGSRAGGLVISLGIMVSYWVLYITGDSLTQNGTMPAWIAMWMANVIFGALALYSVKRAW